MGNAEHNLLLGSRGEDIAAEFFSSRGAVILGRNVCFPGGELDVIAQTPEGEVVFVEVKTRSGRDYGGVEAVTPAKFARMRRAAAQWLQGKPYVSVRFDVVVVFINGENSEIEHYQGVCDGAW